MHDDQKPQVDKSVVAKWVKDFQARGFCVLDDATSREPSLFNRLRGRKVSVQYARRDFRDHCRAGKLVSGIPDDAYILGCLPLIVGTCFEPRGGDIVTDSVTGMSFGNLCQTYSTTHDSAGVSPLFHEFFARMFRDDGERQIVLQYFAHIFQRPRERPSWHLMIPSAMGTGKGVLVEKILNPLLLHTSIATSFGKLTAQHSTVLADNLVVLLDDCKATTASQQTQLKSLLSEERVYIDRKFQDARMVPTYARIILASNEQKPLELEEGERRWFVVQRVEHVQDQEETQQFVAALADWLDQPGSLCKVFNYFMTYDLSGFNAKSVPRSRGLDTIVNLSRDKVEDFVADYVQERPVFAYGELVRAVGDEGFRRPDDNRLGDIIAKLGLRDGRPRVEGKQMSLYFPASMSAAEAAALYEPASF